MSFIKETEKYVNDVIKKCGYEIDNVKICPVCKSSKVRFVGGGTQKVVEELNKEFPTARVLRMDMDLWPASSITSPS